MKYIAAQFKDDTDRMITVAMFIITLFASFIPSLIVIFIPKNYISESTYEIAKTLFNFELLLFLVSLLCWVPFIGWIASIVIVPVICIWNAIIVVINLCSIARENAAKLPEYYKFM